MLIQVVIRYQRFQKPAEIFYEHPVIFIEKQRRGCALYKNIAKPVFYVAASYYFIYLLCDVIESVGFRFNLDYVPVNHNNQPVIDEYCSSITFNWVFKYFAVYLNTAIFINHGLIVMI